MKNMFRTDFIAICLTVGLFVFVHSFCDACYGDKKPSANAVALESKTEKNLVELREKHEFVGKCFGFEDESDYKYRKFVFVVKYDLVYTVSYEKNENALFGIDTDDMKLFKRLYVRKDCPKSFKISSDMHHDAVRLIEEAIR